MLHDLIQVGGVAFWSIMACFLVTEFIFVAKEVYWWIYANPVVVFGFLLFFSNWRSIEYLNIGWKAFIIVCISYLIIGLIWALFGKWYFFCRKRALIYQKCLKEFNVNSVTDLENEQLIDFSSRIKREFMAIDNARHISLYYVHYDNKFTTKYMYVESLKKYIFPNPSDYKAKIIAWMAIWPLSVLGHLIFDFLHDLYEWIYNVTRKLFVLVAHLAFRGMREEFK